MKETGREWANAQFVNDFVTAELVFPQISIIGLRLSDSTAKPGEPGHRDLPFRFRMTADRARELAKSLLESADEIEGTDQPRQ